MNVLDVLRSLAGAFGHRLRAALTLLGIAIGTGSIVLIASLMSGGEAYLMHANQGASDDDVIEAYAQNAPPDQANKTTRPLTRTDANELGGAGVLPPGAIVAQESSSDGWAHYEDRQKRVAVASADASTLTLYKLDVAVGRMLDDEDRTRGARVCVVGHEIYEELLHSAPLTSPRTIAIDDHLLSVVGVLADKPLMGHTDGVHIWNRKVLVPETTYDALYSSTHEIGRIYVRGAPRGGARDTARATMRGVLLRRHLGVLNFALGKDQSGGTEELIMRVVEILLVGTGVLALLASGINIMNVMLVTVSERTREIGLRRAIGATPGNILVQFLLEAMMFSFVGAVAGVVVGVLLSWATTLLARTNLGYWELVVPPWSVGLGLTLAVLTGLVFGILPAWRAAHVSPIDALRSE